MILSDYLMRALPIAAYTPQNSQNFYSSSFFVKKRDLVSVIVANNTGKDTNRSDSILFRKYFQ